MLPPIPEFLALLLALFPARLVVLVVAGQRAAAAVAAIDGAPAKVSGTAVVVVAAATPTGICICICIAVVIDIFVVITAAVFALKRKQVF